MTQRPTLTKKAKVKPKAKPADKLHTIEDLDSEVVNLHKKLVLLKKLREKDPPRYDDKIAQAELRLTELKALYQVMDRPWPKAALGEVKSLARELDSPLENLPRQDEGMPSQLEEKIIEDWKLQKPHKDRIRHDIFYYIETVCTIKYRAGLVGAGGFKELREGPLYLNRHQRKILLMLLQAVFDKKPLRAIFLKARQEGITTVLLAFWSFMVLMFPNFRVLFIIDKDAHAKEKKMQFVRWINDAAKYIKDCPTFVGGTSEKTLFLSNGSLIFFESSESVNPGTSQNFDAIHTSEEPKWKAGRNLEVKESMYPGMPIEGMNFIVRESTANGLDMFYQDWKRAESGQSEFLPIFLPWTLSPEYQLPLTPQEKELGLPPVEDERELYDYSEEEDREITEEEYRQTYNLTMEQLKWRRYQILTTFGGSRASFDQEYPTTPAHAFRKTALNFYSTPLLAKVEHQLRSPIFVGQLLSAHGHIDPAAPIHYSSVRPVVDPVSMGSFIMYEKPQEGKRYFIGVDTSEGKQVVTGKGEALGDRTVMVVKKEDFTTVAYIRYREKPEHSWVDLLLLGVYYNLAAINVELDADGVTLKSYFMRTGYPNCLVHPGNGPVQDRTFTRTSPSTRREMLNRGRRAIVQNPASVPDREHYDEMLTFVQHAKTGKPQALPGYFDDIILADAVCTYCITFFLGEPIPEEEEQEPTEVQEPWDVQSQGFRLEDTNFDWRLL